MSAATLLSSASEALLLVLALALPIVGVAALIGLVVASLQAATQVQDQTLAHLPRLVGVGFALVVFGPWMGRELAAFAARMLLSAAR
jgi:flagellar biosynthetic protein FliQ